MGFDYALVHLKYTIPPSLLLTLLYRPLLSPFDLYKVCLLVAIAVISTIPWDSYLIRSGIWTYPPDAVLGPILFRIPIEELFFFFIQTYGTSYLYLCLSRPTFRPACLPLPGSKGGRDRVVGPLGQLILGLGFCGGLQLIRLQGSGTYMGLIIVWAFPFLLLLWTISYPFILRLPLSDTFFPIACPTFYLWLVDTFALRRGTWVIVEGTKLDIHIWPGLEIEEAFFFLVTNTLVVFGLVAFDYATTIFYSFPRLFPNPRQWSFPAIALNSLLLPTSDFDADRIVGLHQAIQRLEKKSRSFYLASSAFESELRTDLVLLYSFCRVADDLIDGTQSVSQAKDWIGRLRGFLRLAYDPSSGSSTADFVKSAFPKDVHQALLQLPVDRLSAEPLLGLLKGFEIDLRFSDLASGKANDWPIATVDDLMEYGRYVAGTVAELFLDLVFYHYGSTNMPPEQDRARFKASGVAMGKALQTVNIARDIRVDAAIGRVYIPEHLLKQRGMSMQNVLDSPGSKQLEPVRQALLDKAFELYHEARHAIDELPIEARAAMRVAVESYMEIGRVLRQKDYDVEPGTATVSGLRRMKVAWKALNGI